MSLSDENVDVLVLGAGPAGASTALTLLNHTTRRVLLVDRAGAPGLSVGELLSPGVEPLLEFIGAGCVLNDDAHDRAQAVQAAWRQAQPSPRDFFFSGRGAGWHLNREKFNRDLLMCAVEAGAQLRLQTSLAELERRSDHWRVRLKTADQIRTLHCRMLVDASGRSARLARRLGAVRQVSDQLLGVSMVMGPGPEGWRDPWPGQTVIEAAPYGWWYAAPLPGGRLIVTLMTDADLARDQGLTRTAVWGGAVLAAPLMRQRAEMRALLQSDPTVRAAYSHRLDPPSGEGWIAVGDAACAFDPLSGMGIGHALASGAHGARAVEAALNGDGDLMVDYAASIPANADHYAQELQASYDDVARFAQSPFWARRAPVASVARAEPVLAGA